MFTCVFVITSTSHLICMHERLSFLTMLAEIINLLVVVNSSAMRCVMCEAMRGRHLAGGHRQGEG